MFLMHLLVAGSDLPSLVGTPDFNFVRLLLLLCPSSSRSLPKWDIQSTTFTRRLDEWKDAITCDITDGLTGRSVVLWSYQL
jgi:hypothetical protein